ncbi:MAG: L-2-amino-thiazoline-4-carboxylic acid hydrolase [Spirochaetaceae bacterium]|jgi:hypothetical protein|nr:L-2-amino-thiazoline-4-carboxylic acid hydrolase [Spirochaetaceae bacterium]
MYNEETHAYLIGLFFSALKSRSKRGIRVFTVGTRYYAEQRGRRMALRALRDGHELNFDTYLAYGEWNPSGTVSMEYVTETAGNSFVERISVCPWAGTFAAMGLRDCGQLYCHEIDRGIIRGFNPELRFEVKSTLNDTDTCIQVFENFVPQKGVMSPPDGKQDWQYHCAHILSAMTDVVRAAGFTEVPAAVKESFIQKYGENAYRGIAEQEINFNLPPSFSKPL